MSSEELGGTVNKLTDFAKGTIAGFVVAAIIFGFVVGVMNRHYKGKELVRYAEKQIEIQELLEDYVSRDPVEFLDVPGVRGAVDGATADFLRKRDEAVQRLRNRLTD